MEAPHAQSLCLLPSASLNLLKHSDFIGCLFASVSFFHLYCEQSCQRQQATYAAATHLLATLLGCCTFHENTRIYGLSNLGSGEKFQNPHLILCAIQMPFFLVLRNNVTILKPEVFPLKTQNKWSCLHFGTCFHFLMRTSCIPSRYWLSLTFRSSLRIIKTQLEGLGKNICSDCRHLDHLWRHLSFLKAYEGQQECTGSLRS